MDAYQQLVSMLALSMGTAWASGINLYAAIAVLGLMGSSGNMTLPEQLQVLQEPGVIGAACLMYCIEFFADKTPGVDTGWDAIHTFIRIPAGAMLAAGAVGDVNPAMVVMAGILGGSISAATHTLKAGTRVMINTIPEPFTNWIASIAEDIAVIAGMLTALHYPFLFLGMLVIFLLMLVWIFPRVWRGMKSILYALKRMFAGKSGVMPPSPPSDTGVNSP